MVEEQFTVYIVRCSDGSYYTGLTRKTAEARVWEHNAKVVPGYTSSRTPVELAFGEVFTSVIEAISRERQIKGWSREKKEALIANDYEGLPRLSKNRKQFPKP